MIFSVYFGVTITVSLFVSPVQLTITLKTKRLSGVFVVAVIAV
ncbi:hypothetical protein [Flavisolibacter tropicus]|nr:hypothetical protein [Flavisolibacter tropicus]